MHTVWIALIALAAAYTTWNVPVIYRVAVKPAKAAKGAGKRVAKPAGPPAAVAAKPLVATPAL